MIDIRSATQSDFNVCRQFDKFNKDTVLEEKIDRGMVILAWAEDSCVGYLRSDWFWNRHPYLCLIKVLESRRNQGIGFNLLSYWENYLKSEGFKFSLSSSQENEPPAVEWHLK